MYTPIRLLFLVVLSSISLTAFGSDNPLEVVKPASVDSVFSSLRGDTPGCAVGVMSRGKLLYSHAYGLANLELNVPLSVNSEFGLDSMSKQFTAMSVLLLESQGKLAQSQDIHKYLPELPNYGVPITIADLLHHTSGLKDYGQLLSLAGVHGSDVVTPQMAFEIVRRQRDLNFVPNSKFSYSDTNYFLLGMIVERVSGKPLAEFAREQIFTPLGMGETQFLQDRTKVVPQVATGYRKRSDGWHIGFSGDQAVGASGAVSTVSDLAKWDSNFYEEKIAGRAVIRLMTEPARLSDGSIIGYGGGLEIKSYRGLEVVQHAGDGLGFQTAMLRFPKQALSVVVLCNSRDWVSPTDLAQRVADLYLLKNSPPAESLRESAIDDTEDHKKFVGVYWDGETDLLREILIKENKLMQRLVPDDAPRALRHISGNRFGGSSGIVYEFTASGDSFTRTAPTGENSTYHRIPEADLRQQDASQFAGRFYAQSIDTVWEFAENHDRLVLQRRGFPDEILDFEFRDSYLGDLGLFRFLRDKSGAVNGLEIMNFRLGKVSFTREAR